MHWLDSLLSRQVTKLHTFSFFTIPAISRIVAQTGHKQSNGAFLALEVIFLFFITFSYSVF